MKAIQVFALCTLALSASALRATSQFEEFSFESDTAKVFTNLIKMGEIDETKEVSAILNKVKTETDSEHDTLVADFAEITRVHKETVKRLKARIADLKDKIAQKKIEIKAQEALIDRTQAAIDRAEANIAQAKKDIDEENKRRARQHAIYVKKINELTEGIAACADALKIMQKFASMDLNKKEQIVSLKKGAFVQAHSELKTAFSKIRDSIKSHIQSSTYIMMLEALLEVAEQGVNDDLVSRITREITALQATLASDKQATIDADAADLKAHNELIAHLNNVIKQNQAIIDDLTPKLAKYKAQLVKMRKELASLEAALKKTEEALDQENKNYAHQKQRYTTIIKRLAADSKALAFCLNYLKQQTYANGETNLNQ